MTGRGRRKNSKLLTEITVENRRDLSGQPEEQFSLPDELWEQILSKLSLKDNIRSSAVSKTFLAIAASVQKSNKPPWLVFCPTFGDLYEFYDPLKRKSYWIELPELRGARIIHSKYGWLVIWNHETLSLFLFCPYTRELIKLPSLSRYFVKVAFSASPTSPNCMLFSVSCTELGTFELITCRPGDTEWTSVNYPHDKLSIHICHLFFSKGLLYCFSSPCVLGIYNPEEGSWTLELITIVNHPEHFCSNNLCDGEFMVELDGEIFVICACTHTSPNIHKLDLPNKKWVEVETIGGMTLFINFFSSHARTDLLGSMRNSVYFPKVQFYGKRCLSYSLDKGRYLPGKSRFNWRKLNSFESVWIDAPEDLSAVL